MSKKPEIKIETRKVADLVPSARNARTHSEEQVAQIVASIQEFGFLNPLLIDSDNGIIAGHGRVLAASKLRMKTVPVVVIGHLDEVQKKALAIADNKIPLNAGWDKDILRVEIDELMKAGYTMDIVAFSADEMAELYGLKPKEGNTEDDDIPKPKTKVSKLGDTWLLGGHRVRCGSATNPKDVAALMLGEKASLIFTDPPYGVSYESASLGAIKNDELRDDALLKELLVPALKAMVRHAAEKSAFYIWHASSTRDDFVHALKAAGLSEKQYIIWVKPTFVLGHADYHWNHEPCFYAGKAGETPNFYGSRDQITTWSVTSKRADRTETVIGKGLVILDGNGDRLYIQPKEPRAQKKIRIVRVTEGQKIDVTGHDTSGTAWEIAKDTTKYVHPTQKPVELATRAIQNSSAPGEVVLDLFLGSGSTLIGAEKLSRRCFGMDLDPKFVDTVVRRWQDFTGLDAILEGTDKTYNEIEKKNGKKNAALK